MSTRGSAAWRAAYWGPGCDQSVIVAGYWIIGAGKIQCRREAMPAFRALGRVMQKYGYHVRTEDTGAYNCRSITNSSVISAHAQGIALDVNWNTNPYRTDKLVTDMPSAMVAEILEIRTESGAGRQIFRWGGNWDGDPSTPHSNYDAMHWEIVVTPKELERAGFTATLPLGHLDDPKRYPLLARGEHGPAVRYVQDRLGVDVDGSFGEITEKAVESYQAARKMTPDGVVGLGTWTALLSNMRELAASDPSPHKL